MQRYCVEEADTEHFLDKFLPGGEPTAEDFKAFYYPGNIDSTEPKFQRAGGSSDGKAGLDANEHHEEVESAGLKEAFTVDIGKLAQSVLQRAQVGSKERVVIRSTDFQDIPRSTTQRRPTPACDLAVFLTDDRFKAHVCVPKARLGTHARLKNHATAPVATVRRSFADIVVPIIVQVQHHHCAFEFAHPERRLTRYHREDGCSALEGLEDTLASIFGRQHRTHVISLYVYREQARMVVTDRDICIVSPPFPYTASHENALLHRFFWRLAHLDRKDLGYDPTVTAATKDDFRGMLKFAKSSSDITPYVRDQLCYALCVDPPAMKRFKSGRVPRLLTYQWPLQRVTRADGSFVLVGRPTWAKLALFDGRTRGYVVYDPSKQEAYFMKDCWRADHPGSKQEHEVYERLAAAGVEGVLTCYGGEDVPDGTDGWQRTRASDYPVPARDLRPKFTPSKPARPGHPGFWFLDYHDGAGTYDSLSSEPDMPWSSRHARVHYRIFLKEICRPLTGFRDWKELVSLLLDALRAHRNVWMGAGVLHQDVSINNILVLEVQDDQESGETNTRRVGMLCDWELCEYKENMTGERRTTDQFGTWAFRSALSSHFPLKPYQVSDDVESFIHVLHVLILQFQKTCQTTVAKLIYSQYYESGSIVEDCRLGRPISVAEGSKLCALECGLVHLEPIGNETLKALLLDLAALCQKHYRRTNMEKMYIHYAPFAAPPGAAPLLGGSVMGEEDAPGRTSPSGLVGAAQASASTSAPASSVVNDADPDFHVVPRKTRDGPPPPLPNVLTHKALIAVLEARSNMEWPESDLARNDVDYFQQSGVCQVRDMFSEPEPAQPAPSERRQPAKKRKVRNGSAATVKAAESSEEGGGH